MCCKHPDFYPHPGSLSWLHSQKTQQPAGRGSFEGPRYLSLIVLIIKQAHMPAKCLPHSFAKWLDSSLIITANRKPGKCLSRELTPCRAQWILTKQTHSWTHHPGQDFHITSVPDTPVPFSSRDRLCLCRLNLILIAHTLVLPVSNLRRWSHRVYILLRLCLLLRIMFVGFFTVD